MYGRERPPGGGCSIGRVRMEPLRTPRRRPTAISAEGEHSLQRPRQLALQNERGSRYAARLARRETMSRRA